MTDLPAILGGVPVRPQGPPDWPGVSPEVSRAVEVALHDGSWGKYDGVHVERLEAALAEYHQTTYALTCASGTLAVEIGLRALGVGPGDEVIVPAYDYEANFLCVHAVGALPVLVDVAAQNWCLDLDRLSAALGPRTRAILVSHLHGGVLPMQEVMAFARRHGQPVLEDAAQATGATIQGRKAGSWGDVGVLSFGGSKLLTAGRGGALLTNHAAMQQRIRVLLRRGVQQWAALSELQAAALRPQLARLDEANARRTENVERLLESGHHLPGLCPFLNLSFESAPAYYKLGFQYDAEEFGLPRERFVAALQAEGIAFDDGFRAVHIGRAPTRFRAVGDLTQATRAHNGCVILHHPVLLGEPTDIEEVARAIAKVYANVLRLK